MGDYVLYILLTHPFEDVEMGAALSLLTVPNPNEAAAGLDSEAPKSIPN